MITASNARISRIGPAGLTLAYEVGPVPDVRAAVRAVVGSLAWYNAMDAVKQRTCCSAVFKLRCGGLEAAAFPSPEQVAFTLDTCRSAGVPLKFTAGLHHPLRHLDPGLQTPMHGFVNVLAAGALAHARRRPCSARPGRKCWPERRPRSHVRS